MITASIAHHTRLAGTQNQNIYRLVTSKFTRFIQAVFSFFVSTLVAMCRKTFKLTAFLAILVIILGVVGAVAIQVNLWRTDYSIVQNPDGSYRHVEDERTTAILNYMTGRGALPQEELLVVTRLYVKNMLEEAEMEVPENIGSLDMKGLSRLVLRWHQENSSDHKLDTRVFVNLFHDVSAEAARPPLNDFGPEVYDQLWSMMNDVGAPKIRWLEERDEYASQLVASSATEGDKQAFYDPIDHTIYIRYGDSAQILFHEAPHPKQFREHPHRSYVRLIGALLHSFVGGVLSEANRIYKEGYREPETLEGEAHNIIQTELLQKHGLADVNEQVSTKPDDRHECVLPDSLVL